MMADTEKE